MSRGRCAAIPATASRSSWPSAATARAKPWSARSKRASMRTSSSRWRSASWNNSSRQTNLVTAGDLGDGREPVRRLAIGVVRILIEADDRVADDHAAKPDVHSLLVLGAELGAERCAIGGEPLVADLHRRRLDERPAQPLLEPRHDGAARLVLRRAGVDLGLL